MIKHATFPYSLLSKALENKTKAIEDQWIKQLEALEALKPEKKNHKLESIKVFFPKEMRTNELKMQ